MRPVGVEAREPVAGHAAHACEITAEENFAIRLSRHGEDAAVDRRRDEIRGRYSVRIPARDQRRKITAASIEPAHAPAPIILGDDRHDG